LVYSKICHRIVCQFFWHTTCQCRFCLWYFSKLPWITVMVWWEYTGLPTKNETSKQLYRMYAMYIFFSSLYNKALRSSLYIYAMLVCLSVWIQYTSKRLNRSSPNFVWDITSHDPGRGVWMLKLKKFMSKSFFGMLDFKISRKNILKSAISKIILYCMKSRWSQ